MGLLYMLSLILDSVFMLNVYICTKEFAILECFSMQNINRILNQILSCLATINT